jgi:uncharacterized LabA/DUF88 family protein
LASHQERLNIAVFIDFDNIEIGVKNTLGQQFDVGTVLEAIKERGEIVSKIAYADWTRAGDYSRHLTNHAVRLVQRNLTPGGDKNGADINMALDALEMAFTHQHINAYVIVGGDSDFLSLVEKLKQYDRKVFIVGGRAFTSMILQKNCHEFIAYENLSGVRKTAAANAARSGRSQPPPASLASMPVAQAFPIVKRALKILADREVSPQTGLLKSTLLQLDSTFSERNYGASSFLDFTEKLSQAGLVQLKTAGRSVMVELNPDFVEGETPASEASDLKGGAAADPDVVQAFPPAPLAPAGRHGFGDGGRPASQGAADAPGPAPVPTASNAEGVEFVGNVLRAATSARWPMYIRNVKQLLRAADSGFDERRFGFGGLMDLLRACQRDGLMRLERDRRGGLRVFPGASLQQGATPRAAQAPALPQPDVAFDETVETAYQPPAETVPADALEADSDHSGPQPIDTTAELLGRAKTRRPRAPRAASPGSTRKVTRAAAAAGPRKAAGRRSSRTKKSDSDADNIGNS